MSGRSGQSLAGSRDDRREHLVRCLFRNVRFGRRQESRVPVLSKSFGCGEPELGRWRTVPAVGLHVLSFGNRSNVRHEHDVSHDERRIGCGSVCAGQRRRGQALDDGQLNPEHDLESSCNVPSPSTTVATMMPIPTIMDLPGQSPSLALPASTMPGACLLVSALGHAAAVSVLLTWMPILLPGRRAIAVAAAVDIRRELDYQVTMLPLLPPAGD